MANNKGKMIFLGVVVILMSAGFLRLQESPDKSVAEYKIGPRDLIEVKFFGEEKLSTQVRVSELGRVTLPMIGEVDVSGLTASELEKKLIGLYGEKYLQKPQVFVRILEFRNQRVSILGGVAKQGSFDLLGRQTLMWLISEAGGLTKDVGKEIIVLRQLPDGQSMRLSIPIEDLIFRGDPKLNITLEPGDIVNIPADKEVLIYISGEVKTPGALRILKSNIPSLFQAITQAGGFTERAAESRVFVKRKDENGVERNLTINVRDIRKGKIKDFPLKENDVVIVPQTWF